MEIKQKAKVDINLNSNNIRYVWEAENHVLVLLRRLETIIKIRFTKIKVTGEHFKDKYYKTKKRMHNWETKEYSRKIKSNKENLIQQKWSKEGGKKQRQNNINSKQNKMAQ